MTEEKPTHLGFILDGNRRWAKERGLPEYEGHVAGYKALKQVIEGAFKEGVQYVSIYAFSNENWKRDKQEVSNIMKLIMHAILHDLDILLKQKIQVRFIGRREGLEGKLLSGLEKAETATRQFNERTLLVCFNYGGQQEIIDAVRQCIADGLTPEEVDEEAIAARLYAPEVPPVDMIVRTSGEQRLSNFMLWRSSYSEFCFLPQYWPDMTKADVHGIIEEYSRRHRRFGGNK